MSHSPTHHIRQVDVAIIGAGTAGQNAFAQVSQVTDNLVIINDGYWTTTCATVGCMPSKLLIAAAERAYHACHSQQFGINTPCSTDTKAHSIIDGQQVMRRVRAERDRFTHFITEKIAGWDNAQKISGRATINADGYIVVGNQIINATHIIVATGSTPYIPDGWTDALGATMLTSDTVFELPDIPHSLAVIGAGAIGLELAQAFSRLGSQVTLLNHAHRIAGISDSHVNKKAIACLTQALNMQLGVEITEVSQQDGQAVIHYQDADNVSHCWQGDYVLVATGRRNHLAEIGIENLGVVLDKHNRPQQLNEVTGQIADKNVYIIGDANAHLPLLHVASNEGFHAGQCVKDTIINDKQTQTVPQPTLPAMAVVFSEPQIANVGLSLTQIEEAGHRYVVGEVSFDNQGRSRVMGVNCGLLRIYASMDKHHHGKILGASMVAPDAEYIAHILATAMSNDLTINDLLNSPFYHPTILEGLRTALRATQAQLEQSQHKQH
ncbi:dihydrolipoyl dehydrogenase [Psychrobacter sp. I-STPA6b]|uniref:dihydrolipoyl dehydrogenase n=1 Tax=Psychrobacter sp. I-STPA6b TaxID=2585718 RepID=UPI001D0C56A5|nr:dihydrolipoyl dehydrogenase [Psychrobacter sp. I-STPA6b]